MIQKMGESHGVLPVAARLRHIAGTRGSTKRCMDVKRLENGKETAACWTKYSPGGSPGEGEESKPCLSRDPASNQSAKYSGRAPCIYAPSPAASLGIGVDE